MANKEKEQNGKSEKSYRTAFRLMTVTVILLLVFFIGFRALEDTAAKRAGSYRAITETTLESTAQTKSALDGLQVNVNTASVLELTLLPGIGESRAKDIVAYRNEYGSFTQPEDLLKIKGIGEATLEKLRPYLVF